jgi:DNA-binding response OmpR family regulator
MVIARTTRMRILIVEDDLVIQKLTSRILSEAGKCEIVKDGFQGLKSFRLALLKNEPYEVILIDIMLPQMDGLTLLKKIRKMEKNLDISENTLGQNYCHDSKRGI